MKFPKITTCLLMFSSPLYAQQAMDVDTVDVLEEMVISSPVAESSDDLAHPMIRLRDDELRNKIGATLG